MPYSVFADSVLLLHFAIVVFVVLGLPAILIGNMARWRWVNILWWRLVHLAAIGIVALQAWFGQYCPLTVLESMLREQAGQESYSTSFIGHWVQVIMYYDAPLWALAIVYTVFGLLVAWAWWRYPPRRRKPKNPDA